MAEQTDIQTLAEKIKGIRVAMLTTYDEKSHSLASRPMATQELDFDGQLWFFTRETSGAVESIRADQHVGVSYADESKHRWISVAGRGRVVRDRAKMKELWSPAVALWFDKGIDDPQLALICVDVESAQIWDSPSGAWVMLLGFAKRMITGQAPSSEGHVAKIDLRH